MKQELIDQFVSDHVFQWPRTQRIL